MSTSTSTAATSTVNPTPAKENDEEPRWGRVIIAGGTDWLKLGRKDKTAGSDDLAGPFILRALSNVKITKIITSSSAPHAVFIDTKGNAHFIGKNSTSCFGIPSTTLPFSPHPTLRSPQLRLHPSEIPLAHKIYANTLPGSNKDTKIIGGAVGKGHTILIGDGGEVWAAGKNGEGECGVQVRGGGKGSGGEELEKWVKVEGEWNKSGTKIVKASAGNTFSLFLGDNGKVYACGSSANGQLGNGKTGERIVSAGKTAFDVVDYPTLIKPFYPGKIVSIASGSQHSLAMADDGYVFAWGYAGYGRLGLGDQKDKLVPTMIPSFAGNNIMTRASMITCGPTCSIVIDRQKMYQMCGKWKTTGEGGSGSAFMHFKYIQDIMSCKVLEVSSGGNGHFLITPADVNEVMCVGFGQGCANSELGLGANQPKNATKPTRIEPLNGVDAISVGGAQFTTFWLAHPNDVSSELPRWPEDLETHDICLICNVDRKKDMPLECERCENPFHLTCLTPPLESIPEGEWFCDDCIKEGEAEKPAANAGAGEKATTPKGKGVKRKAEDDEVSVGSGKNKAGPSKKRK